MVFKTFFSLLMRVVTIFSLFTGFVALFSLLTGVVTLFSLFTCARDDLLIRKIWFALSSIGAAKHRPVVPLLAHLRVYPAVVG